MAAPAPAKFRIDVDIHNLLMNSTSSGPKPAEAKGHAPGAGFSAVSGAAQ